MLFLLNCLLFGSHQKCALYLSVKEKVIHQYSETLKRNQSVPQVSNFASLSPELRVEADTRPLETWLGHCGSTNACSPVNASMAPAKDQLFSVITAAKRTNRKHAASVIAQHRAPEPLCGNMFQTHSAVFKGKKVTHCLPPVNVWAQRGQQCRLTWQIFLLLLLVI